MCVSEYINEIFIFVILCSILLGKLIGSSKLYVMVDNDGLWVSA